MKGLVVKKHPELQVLLWTFLLIFFSTGCRQISGDYIHDYYPLVYQGDLAFFKKDYTTTYNTLKKAVKMKRPPNFEPYRELEKLANVSAILGKTEEAVGYIQQLVDRGYELTPFQTDTTYALIWQDPKWTALVEDYPTRRKAYLKRIDLTLRKQIIEMNRKDLEYRSKPDRQSYQREIKEQDAANMAQLKEIFETKGYPNPDLIGHESVDGIARLGVESILMHSPDSIRQAYFIPKIRSFVEDGQCPPRILAALIDQYHLTHDRYQIYGTMVSPGGTVDYIHDPKQLETLRQSIGLPTLHQEFQRDSVIRLQFLLQ